MVEVRNEDGDQVGEDQCPRGEISPHPTEHQAYFSFDGIRAGKDLMTG